MSLITGQTVVVTGGTGSFGRCFVRRLLTMEGGPKRVCVLSRDEYKQGMMRVEFDHDPRLRFFLGDVRDIRRLAVAFQGAALVVHAAALKQIPACEYNIEECVATNIMGALNVAKAAIECGVPRVIALSTDKAVSPATGYGASKMMLERIIVNENAMAWRGKTRLACTRYGNVQDSRLSVLPVWREAKARGEALPVTHPDATRFHMTQEDACDLVFIALAYMEGGEVFVPKLRAYRIGDLAEAVAPGWTRSIIGLRAAEKMHESLIGEDELRYARDYGSHYRIFPAEHPWRDERPAPPGGEPLPEGMRYRSDAVLRMDVAELREAIGAF